MRGRYSQTTTGTNLIRGRTDLTVKALHWVLNDACVDVEEVVPSHTGLLGHAGWDDDHVGTVQRLLRPCLVSLFTQFLAQKCKSPPKQAGFHPTFHERTFLARWICTTSPIIQNTPPMRCFRKRGLKSIAAPESPVTRPELLPRLFCRPGVPVTPDDSTGPDEFLPPVVPLYASRPTLLCRCLAPACAARTPPRRGIHSSTLPSGNASVASSSPWPPHRYVRLVFSSFYRSNAELCGESDMGEA
jgi:hypothetical protein